MVDLIKNSLTMNSHFEKTKLVVKEGESAKPPVCLILDEIDGALGGSTSFGSGGGGEQARGLKLVADYLEKAIKAAEKT